MNIQQPSKIRSLALELFNDLYSVGEQYVKHKTIYTFFKHFFKPRVDSIILNEVKEEEIKDIMWKIKRKIDISFKQFDTIEQIKNAPVDPTLTAKIMKLPDFEKLEDLY